MIGERLGGLLAKLTGRWKAPSVAGPYEIYTTDFDRVIRADALDTVLGAPSREVATALNDGWSKFQQVLDDWRRQYSGPQEREVGRIAAAFPPDAGGTAITLLIDQSGSMRGLSMRLTAAATVIATEKLQALGATIEVLGFTTSSWRGGESRKRWRRNGSLPNPGRLCDLLHVIYRDRTDPPGPPDEAVLRAMLRPDLLKENVDGEALAWAAGRLRAAPEKRKLLIVLSDGAPVDDSTLMNNHADILWNHTLEVIGAIEASEDVTIAAVGIGYDVSRYYVRSRVVTDSSELMTGMFSVIADVLTSAKRSQS